MDAGFVATVALVYAMSRRRPRIVRRCWVHTILRKRLQWGEYHVLVQELRLDGVLFQQYFRMSKDAFDELFGKVGPLIAKADTRMRLSIGPAERLAICLRYLATGDSYRTIAFSYRVGHATVAVIVKEVAGAIWTALVEETMPVPQTEDWRAIAAGFQERWNFPNCVGAIDGKHVVIQAPANSGSLYFNYKSTHSLVLLAVVDAQYLFRVVDVGGFGRSSDGGSLRNSAFGEGLRDGSLQLPPDTVIPGAERLGLLPHVFVGDEAFPLLDNLLRPFPGRQLTRERRLFNYRLSRARLVVECAFGILSSQWRMFRRVITTSPEVTELCVKATCVLHNFLRRKTIGRSSRTPVIPVVAESSDEAPTLRDAPMMGSNNATRRSIQLRETFCSYLNEEGVVSWQHKVV
ncbi:protein ANTAGONIST OF LIKE HETEROCHROMATIN PROTEIN 1-like [Gymnodraco acuticeps]|uniref:Protein ANTAGONIST OF LIKE HETEROCHROMATIN PROTEIN 1-like n=1 Tax=Gymnodraco acuticeps TaxID=8218 RepID=A0A6P8UTU7_GYMAC|nr:protein ANTAGONIST OF LIKE HETEROCHROMATIN PROTEIN 1-like [Gymnodraco acuticeps]